MGSFHWNTCALTTTVALTHAATCPSIMTKKDGINPTENSSACTSPSRKKLIERMFSFYRLLPRGVTKISDQLGKLKARGRGSNFVLATIKKWMSYECASRMEVWRWEKGGREGGDEVVVGCSC